MSEKYSLILYFLGININHIFHVPKDHHSRLVEAARASLLDVKRG